MSSPLIINLGLQSLNWLVICSSNETLELLISVSFNKHIYIEHSLSPKMVARSFISRHSHEFKELLRDYMLTICTGLDPLSILQRTYEEKALLAQSCAQCTLNTTSEAYICTYLHIFSVNSKLWIRGIRSFWKLFQNYECMVFKVFRILFSTSNKSSCIDKLI